MPPTCSTTASTWPIPKRLLPPAFQAFISPHELRDAVMQGAMDHSAFETACENLSPFHRHMLFGFPLQNKERRSGVPDSSLEPEPEDREGEGDMVEQACAARQANGGSSAEDKTPVMQMGASTSCLCADQTQPSNFRVPVGMVVGGNRKHPLSGFKLYAAADGHLLKSSRRSLGDNLMSARQAILRERQNRDGLSSSEMSGSFSTESSLGDGSPLDEITGSARLGVFEKRVQHQQREALRDTGAMHARLGPGGADTEQRDPWQNRKKRNRSSVSVQIDAPSKKLRELEGSKFDGRKDSLDGP